MKRFLRILTIAAMTAFTVMSASAQDGTSLADDFIRDFRAADGAVKLQILQASTDHPADELEPLYLEVLEFVVGNAGDRITDQSTRDMYQTAVNRLEETGSTMAALRVWEIFELDRNTSQRLFLLEALQVIGRDVSRLYARLNNWVLTQNSLARSGQSIDRQVLGTAIQTIASFDDPFFLEALLITITYGYAGAIDDPAREAVRNFGDQQVDLLKNLIPRQALERQLEQLDYIRRREDFTIDEQAEIAAEVLDFAVNRQISTSADRALNRRLRNEAAALIRDAAYEPASLQVLEHFNIAAVDYENRRISQAEMLDAIEALGSVGTQEAAIRLTRYMEYLNTQTQNDRPVSTQVVLTVINNLRDLGYADAYSTLFYATMLEYPSRVQDALQEAVDEVRQ